MTGRYRRLQHQHRTDHQCREGISRGFMPEAPKRGWCAVPSNLKPHLPLPCHQGYVGCPICPEVVGGRARPPTWKLSRHFFLTGQQKLEPFRLFVKASIMMISHVTSQFVCAYIIYKTSWIGNAETICVSVRNMRRFRI